MIPAALTDIPRWILWRYEVRDDKATKVPCDLSGRPASVTDPKSWLSYDEASFQYEEEVRRAEGAAMFSGVGFCFSADDDIVGIDLDDCLPLRDDGRRIFSYCQSYAEISPSGKGIKIIGRAAKPEGSKNRTSEVQGLGQIEVYDRDRFFTVTGDQYGFSDDINDIQDGLDWVCQQFLAPATPDQGLGSARAPVEGSSLLQRAAGFSGTDGELMLMVCSDEKFARLWHGDMSDYDDDYSRARMALLNEIAYYAGPVPERIEALFDSSALGAHEKWVNRPKLRESEIAKVLASKTIYYSAPTARPFEPDTPGLTPEQAQDLGAHGWQPISLVGEARAMSAIGPPDVGGGLFYEQQRHVFSGEADVGKTWVALWAAAQEIKAGNPVLWVNTDDAPATELVERLGLLGITEAMIEASFVYLAPGYKSTPEDVASLAHMVRDRGIRLSVIDSFNPALMLEGLDPNSTTEVDAFFRKMATPLVAAASAVVLIDHLPKNQENHGRYSYGSERKLSGVSSHIGARGKGWSREEGGGTVNLWNLKDRSGHRSNPRKQFARFELSVVLSTAEGKLTPYSEDGDAHRPTHLMEKVSAFMEHLKASDPDSSVGKRTIFEGVTGKKEYVQVAIDCLVEEGHITLSDGPRGALLHTLHRPFTVSA